MKKLLFNYVAILGSSIFTGVMLSIGVTLGGYWASLPPDIFLEWFSSNNEYISRLIPAVFIPTVFGLIGSIVLAWGSKRQRMLWLSSGLCMFLLAVITFSFFVPMNSSFINSTIETGQVTDALDLWLDVHAVRIFLALTSSILGLIAVSYSNR